MKECNPKDCGLSPNGVCLEDINNLDVQPTLSWEENSLSLYREIKRFRGNKGFELSGLMAVLDNYPRCVWRPCVDAYFSMLLDDLTKIRASHRSPRV